MSHPGPVVQKLLLGQELRTLRTQAGLDLSAAMRLLGCSRSKITLMEIGDRLPGERDLEELLELYSATDQLERLTQMRTAAKEHPWYYQYRLRPIVQEFLGLETGATTVERFTVTVFPGMLQTEAYMRELGRDCDMPQEEKERHLTARLRRSERLYQGDVTLSAVVTEAVLQRATYMGAVGIEQLQLLHEATAMPNVTIRVLPFRVGSTLLASGSFTIFTFPTGLLKPMAHQDHATSEVITGDTATVDNLRTKFETLHVRALPDDESAEFIERFIQKAKV